MSCTSVNESGYLCMNVGWMLYVGVVGYMPACLVGQQGASLLLPSPCTTEHLVYMRFVDEIGMR